MSIVQMKRLRVISLSDQTDMLLRDLTSLGCVELNEPVGNPNFSGLALPCEPNTQDISEKKGWSKQQSTRCPRTRRKSRFCAKRSRNPSFDADFSRQFGYAKEIHDITAQIAAESAKKQIQLDIASLKPWEGIDLPLDYQEAAASRPGSSPFPPRWTPARRWTPYSRRIFPPRSGLPRQTASCTIWSRFRTGPPRGRCGTRCAHTARCAFIRTLKAPRRKTSPRCRRVLPSARPLSSLSKTACGDGGYPARA